MFLAPLLPPPPPTTTTTPLRGLNVYVPLTWVCSTVLVCYLTIQRPEQRQKTSRLPEVPHFSSGETRARVHPTRERRDAMGREKNEALFPPRVTFSRVGWFSRMLAFRSFYYPWGQMGTTRSLKNKRMPIYRARTRARTSSQDSSQAGLQEAWFVIPSQKLLLHWKWHCQKHLWPEPRKCQKMKWMRAIKWGLLSYTG